MTDPGRPRHPSRRVGGALVALAVVLVAVLVAIGQSRGSGSASASSASAGAGAESTRDASGPMTGAPELRPPQVTVLDRTSGLAPGLIFLGAKDLSAPREQPGGPLIVDDLGRPVWYRPLPPGRVASDVRVQQYQGRPVLTWWQGRSIGGAGHGEGEGVIADSSYNVIARVHAGNGCQADQHSFVLTPQGTALVTAYHETRRDLSSVGGPPHGEVYDGIVQEIDVATGRVLFEWHSLDHVPLDESFERVPRDPDRPYDYFHINSVSLDHDGNLLISSRHTWTVYKVDRHTGQIIWRLGGKRSDFEPGPGVPFAWQHNPVSAGRDTLRIFDNESNGIPLRPESRVITVRLHPQRKTATLVQQVEHPAGLSVPSQGNSERLPGGDLFVGWGRLGRFSEFSPDGRLLFDATLPPGYDSYRAYRFPWTGHPTTGPTASARRDGPDTEVDANWNGATNVASWRILAGPSPGALKPVGTVAWNGLDTGARVRTNAKWVEVAAEDATGRTVGSSAPVRVSNPPAG
jgi:Arylsulfotransferase (ASST)